MALTDRQRVLGSLLLVVGVLTLVLLSRVLETVFFAITIAYVLYPIRRELVHRGVPRRLAAAAATVVGFVAAVAIITPIVVALYSRRAELFTLIRNIPREQSVTLFGFTYVVDVSQVVVQLRDALASIAVSIASASPVLALKGFLFLLLVYGLLLRPESVREATLRIVPGEYHDVTLSLHRRIRDTLYALYVLQAATALGTFLVAYLVFWSLGYDAAFTLAVFSGILQFIPILGPSLLIVLVAAGQLLAGEVAAAVLVTIVGLVLVGFLPDALIRPRLASLTTGMPASLYFVGFVGGTLTVGVVGVIAGPLVVALLVEVVEIVTRERDSVQQTFAEAAVGAGPSPTDGTDRSEPTNRTDRPGTTPRRSEPRTDPDSPASTSETGDETPGPGDDSVSDAGGPGGDPDTDPAGD